MIDRSKYEKITDDIMIIANRVVLRMNVSLSYYNQESKRYNFHREVEYYSQKANKNLINIKRNFDYYLSIEHIITKDYIRIGIRDILKLRYALDEAYKFFTDPRYKNLYAKKDGELILYMKPDPIIITDLSMDKYLQFEPCIYTDFRGEAQRGLRMFLSSTESYCDISINNLEAFKYIIDTINLYESAQLMINYIERPDFGTNLYTFNTEPDDETNADFQGKEGRQVDSKKNMSYFDKMKGLEE